MDALLLDGDHWTIAYAACVGAIGERPYMVDMLGLV
jgi:hypothetical protein